jgi:signal transduction histidine kinase
MTLRVRLVVALVIAAVLPVAVAVGVPLLRAERRAGADADRRLALARRQAEILLAELSRQTAERADRAAYDLAHDAAAIDALVVGPEQRAQEVARPLAERNGLDTLEVRSASGTLLSAFPGALPPSSVPDLPGLAPIAAELGGSAALFARRSVRAGGDTFVVTAARTIDRHAIGTLAAITGGPVVLRDGAGRTIEPSGAPGHPEGWLVTSLPLGGSGFSVEVAVAPGSVERERRDLLGAFAGVAPLALASALVVGLLLAEGIVRPIRSLAARAERIAAEREGSFPILEARNEVTRLTLAFDRMLAALAGSEHRRLAAERVAAWKEVARRIAHEVKNPLSPIQLAVDNLRRTREKAPQDFDRSLREETETILEEVASLKRLVDEFSEFARLPEPRIVPSDPRAIVSQALALFAGRISAAGVAVSVDVSDAPERIACDPDLIGRALKNVLANALDSLERVADRRLEVRCRATGETGARGVVLEVRDSGVGLDAEALRRVFEPYFTTRSDRGGTGLGMAIVHRIVTEHGGSVEVRGGPGSGAVVTIRIPGTAGDPHAA